MNKMYWKLVISLPEVEDDPDGQDTKLLCEWMTAKFRKGTTPNPEIAGKVSRVCEMSDAKDSARIISRSSY